MIAASVISAYEETLLAVIAIAVFLPMVSDRSGCSGNQAVGVTLRELSLGLIRPKDAFRVWLKEISVGVNNSIGLGILIGIVAWVWKGSPALGLVSSLALALNTMLAESIGGVVPLLLKRIGQDPAVASGPHLTTVTDKAVFFRPQPCDADGAMAGVKMDKIVKVKRTKPDLLVIGWMEHLDLPDLDVAHLKAKIDTGARTSALHAKHIEVFDKDGVEWVRFQTQVSDDVPVHWAEALVYDRREIKNTSGVPEERIVIRTRLKLIERSWPISVSLADRSNMTFPMIIGRTALKRHNIAVHTRRANLTSS